MTDLDAAADLAARAITDADPRITDSDALDLAHLALDAIVASTFELVALPPGRFDEPSGTYFWPGHDVVAYPGADEFEEVEAEGLLWSPANVRARAAVMLAAARRAQEATDA